MTAGVLVAFLAGGAAAPAAIHADGGGEQPGTLVLPRPVVEGKVPLERVLAHRRSVREQDGAVFVLAAMYERTEARYGRERAPRYVHMEVGHAAQNLLLQAVALDLGGVPVGAFDDAAVRQVLGLPPGERPLYLLPVGRPR